MYPRVGKQICHIIFLLTRGKTQCHHNENNNPWWSLQPLSPDVYLPHAGCRVVLGPLLRLKYCHIYREANVLTLHVLFIL